MVGHDSSKAKVVSKAEEEEEEEMQRMEDREALLQRAMEVRFTCLHMCLCMCLYLFLCLCLYLYLNPY